MKYRTVGINICTVGREGRGKIERIERKLHSGKVISSKSVAKLTHCCSDVLIFKKSAQWGKRGASRESGVLRNKVINRRRRRQQQDAVFDVVSRLIYELTRAPYLSLTLPPSLSVCLPDNSIEDNKHTPRCTLPPLGSSLRRTALRVGLRFLLFIRSAFALFSSLSSSSSLLFFGQTIYKRYKHK